MHYICICTFCQRECKVLPNPRLIGRRLVAAFANSEVLRSFRHSLPTNWGSARDNFQDMSREGVKSARRYFFDSRADQGRLWSGC